MLNIQIVTAFMRAMIKAADGDRRNVTPGVLTTVNEGIKRVPRQVRHLAMGPGDRSLYEHI